jgi:hypothetical protein
VLCFIKPESSPGGTAKRHTIKLWEMTDVLLDRYSAIQGIDSDSIKIGLDSREVSLKINPRLSVVLFDLLERYLAGLDVRLILSDRFVIADNSSSVL